MISDSVPKNIAGIVNVLTKEIVNLIESFPEMIDLTRMFIKGIDIDKLEEGITKLDFIIEEDVLIKVTER